MPLATTLRSMVESNPDHWPLDVHVLAAHFPAEVRRRVDDSLPVGAATIHWLPVDLDAYPEFSTASGLPKAACARFLIPHVIPKSISRILYLDADILVLGDLAPLWHQDLKGAVVGAVLDGLDKQIKAKGARVARVPWVKQYFNAGVLLMDLGRWRSERISEQALEYLRRTPDSPFGDQDALNVACDGRWTPLHPRWNFQGHLGQRIADIAPEHRPTIIHFITNLKPWNPRALSLNRSLYDGFRRRTRFARVPVERISDFFEAHAMRLHNALSRTGLWPLVWRHAKVWAASRFHPTQPRMD
jgi:lipopolysaccharide biosynthesis glycosyltransferase